MGTLKESGGVMKVQEDFMLATAADIVADPSAHNAFVRGVMENVDWVYDAVSGSWMAQEALDETRKSLKRSTIAQITEEQLRHFERFLNSLTYK